METKQELLANVALFSGCSAKELERLSSLCTQVSVQSGHVLTQQGRVAYECFIVASGTAQVDCDGHVVATVGAGDYFGELALIDHGPRSATVTAMSPMTLLVLNAREFSQALERIPGLANRLLASMSVRVRKSSKLVGA